MPPNPPSNAHGFAMRSMSLRDMQIPKSEKKYYCPPLSNPGDAPADVPYNKQKMLCTMCNISILQNHSLRQNDISHVYGLQIKSASLPLSLSLTLSALIDLILFEI